MTRFKFLLPFLPLIIGALALIVAPMMTHPEIVISFRLGLGAVIFFVGVLVTLWIQALAIVDALREKKARAEIDAAIRDYEDGHRRFIRRLDHELKNPLVSLQVSLENLQVAGDADARRKIEANMQKALERLIHLLRDLRKLSELDESMLEREAVDVPELLTEILEVALSAPGRAERQVNMLVTQVPTPPPPVMGDRDLLGLGLYNLLDNALKFTVQNEAIEVRVRENGREVVIEVADGGPGIHPEEQQRVFEELYRGENALSIEGSGLGLAFVKRIVSLHHGELMLRSRQNEQHGTIFSVRLPAAVTKL